ncbi:aminoglycoside phosphotransferase [Azospirillum doebereinerae]|uniref:Aminoglycoside phosphotransferase n=2 Tax=Azospirillum doebereinerae TaxID=92933 RepID=A0A3S0X094_9PROT|nr:aminoglycoside phosphotransferase [Azospirillum doebereinerae]
MTGCQSAVFAFLADPATHGLSEPVKRIETHGAVVFLAGADVYKVKRAVRFPYMDLSSLEKRRRCCEAEITVNRMSAPTLYLGTIPIVRCGNRLQLGGDGEIVEWAVHLRRFDEEATFDRLADRQALCPRMIDRLARAIVRLHDRAPPQGGGTAVESLGSVLQETLDEIDTASDLFPRTQAARLRERLTEAFDHGQALLRRRATGGKVRRCHGDLHLRNIVLLDDEPVLFDALEFSDDLATSDILYDLAFLIMDLCERGLRGHAARLLNGYLWQSKAEEDEITGLALLPLFLSLRAAIRAKVLAAQVRLGSGTADLPARARAYIAAALDFLEPVQPRLLAIGGLSGSGKSRLSAAVAPAFGLAPGALHLRSDIERKRMFGVAPTDRLPEEAYRPEVTQRVYSTLRRLARIALRAGRGVILDATHHQPTERTQLMELAAEADAPFLGVWLDAPSALLRKRVAMRRDDPSDATVAVLDAQAEEGISALTWHRLNAGVAFDVVEASMLALIQSSDAEG